MKRCYKYPDTECIPSRMLVWNEESMRGLGRGTHNTEPMDDAPGILGGADWLCRDGESVANTP
jgi:hypothetical protein